MNSKVDWYFDKADRWAEEIAHLRTIVLDCGLIEELKWGCPCYTFEGKNVVLIHTFKDYCALLFMKGALLVDAHGLLVQQTENVQAARQIRFKSLAEVKGHEAIIKAYILQAIEVEKSGQKVQLKKASEFIVAEEFQQKLDAMPALREAFEVLTPGRQRAYLLHFSLPKQSKTRIARVEKCIGMIMDGKGLND